MFLVKGGAAHSENSQSTNSLQLQAYPNPNRGYFTILFNLEKAEEVMFMLYTSEGKKIEEKKLTGLHTGQNMYRREVKNLEKGGVYIVTLQSPSAGTVSRKVVVEP